MTNTCPAGSNPDSNTPLSSTSPGGGGAPCTRVLIVLTCALWFGLPLAALLGHLGALRVKETFNPGQLIQSGGIFRLKKGELPALTKADLRHAFVIHDGQRFEKRLAIHELSQPGADASFVLRTNSLHLRPAAPLPPGGRPRGYSLVRTWAPPAWLWWSWGVTSLVVAGTLWRSRWRIPFTNELHRWRHHVIHTFTRFESHPAMLLAYAAVTSALVAAVNWEKLSAPYLAAEDGHIFVEGNFAHGIVALFIPYAGYLHVLPRLIAWASGLLSLEWQPTAMVWLSAAFMSGVYYFIGTWTSWAERLAVAAFFILAPMGGYLMYSPTNLQWFTGLALVLLAIHPSPRPATFPAQMLLLLMATAAALSGPFVILTLPAMLWRAWRIRSRFELLLAFSQAIAAGIQIAILLLVDPDTPTAAASSSPVVSWAAHFTLGLFGRFPSLSASQEQLWGLILAGAILTLFACSLLFWKADGTSRQRLLWMLCFAALFAAAGWARSTGWSRPWIAGDRYYVIPYALIAVGLASIFGSRRPVAQAVAAVALAGMMLGLRSTEPTQIRPPSWVEQVRHISPRGHSLIEIYPPGTEWSLFVAKDEEGKALKGAEYEAVRAKYDARPKRPAQ